MNLKAQLDKALQQINDDAPTRTLPRAYDAGLAALEDYEGELPDISAEPLWDCPSDCADGFKMPENPLAYVLQVARPGPGNGNVSAAKMAIRVVHLLRDALP